jgi:hypothetical protein
MKDCHADRGSDTVFTLRVITQGYGVKTLPGIREAIEERNWKEAQQQIEIVASKLMNYSKQVDAAAAILKLR